MSNSGNYLALKQRIRKVEQLIENLSKEFWEVHHPAKFYVGEEVDIRETNPGMHPFEAEGVIKSHELEVDEYGIWRIYKIFDGENLHRIHEDDIIKK